MSALPTRFAQVILWFAGLFCQRTWQHAQLLLMGAVLVPGARTVASVLRVLGLAYEPHFVNFHRVLSRAVWSPRAAARVLLGLLVRTFVPDGPIVLGVDDTIERRRGARIAALGIYRDPVRSSRSHFVKASGLRWLSVMLLAPIPWAQRVWALPVLTVLAPSERYDQQRGRRHKRLTDYARQLLEQVWRWLPGRELVLVGDSSFAALELLSALATRMTCITRLRLDAALYAPAPPRAPGRPGRPAKKGKRLASLAQVQCKSRTRWQHVVVPHWYGQTARPVEIFSGCAVWYHAGIAALPIRWVLIRDPLRRFDPQALLCTDPNMTALQVVQHYVRRWQVEVTYEEVRRHLSVETQRQWSDLAIARTTPVLLGMFSLVTLLADRLVRGAKLPMRHAAWYVKTVPTFSDALAAVRAHWWRAISLSTSRCERDIIKVPRSVWRRLHEAACYAA
ncbi:IS701 family transposase [Azohydromonas australica]|uniref:IS701 family transposase n=1 Tax=Azohydromonas australica TaxID=364039 RepID=UPI000416EED3|nr:transposase [Azohydromonas australica]